MHGCGLCARRGYFFLYKDTEVNVDDMRSGGTASVDKLERATIVVERRQWTNNLFHFDDVAVALLALYSTSTLEGWPTYALCPLCLPHMHLIHVHVDSSIYQLLFC